MGFNGRSASAPYVTAAQRLFPENVTPILDRLTAQPLCFYSAFWKARSAYTGNCIKVREAGGDTLKDIPFTTGGVLDVAALAAHCGANNGFIHTWYDQKGSANLTQATNGAQPQIWSGSKKDFSTYSQTQGVAVPLIAFDTSDDYLEYLGALGLSGANPNLTIAGCMRGSANEGLWVHMGDSAGGSGTRFTPYRSGASTTARVSDGSTGFRSFTAVNLGNLSRHVVTRASGANMNATVWRQAGGALVEIASASNTPVLQDEHLRLNCNTTPSNFGGLDIASFGVFEADYSAGGNATDLATLEAWLYAAHPGTT